MYIGAAPGLVRGKSVKIFIKKIKDRCIPYEFDPFWPYFVAAPSSKLVIQKCTNHYYHL